MYYISYPFTKFIPKLLILSFLLFYFCALEGLSGDEGQCLGLRVLTFHSPAWEPQLTETHPPSPPVHTLQGMGWEFEWDSAAHCGQFSLLLLRLSEMPGLIQRMYCAALLGLTNVRTKFLSSLDTASSLHNTAYPLTTSVILKCEAR